MGQLIHPREFQSQLVRPPVQKGRCHISILLEYDFQEEKKPGQYHIFQRAAAWLQPQTYFQGPLRDILLYSLHNICLERLLIFAAIICAEKFDTYEICLQAGEQTKGKSSNSLGK